MSDDLFHVQGSVPDHSKSMKPQPHSPIRQIVISYPAEVSAAAVSALTRLLIHPEFATVIVSDTKISSQFQHIDNLDPQIAYPLASLFQQLHPQLLLAPPHLEHEACDLKEHVVDDGAHHTVKQLAVTAVKHNDPVTSHAVSRASMMIPDDKIIAPARPPLPSPPATPPPPPLPTAAYIWDALGRPTMTDGIVLPVVK